MKLDNQERPSGTALLVAMGVTLCLTGSLAQSASHHEAPLTALDHKADIADFYAFVSHDDPGKVTFIQPAVFTGFIGAGDGVPAPSNSPPPVAPGTPLVPPAITALDG